MRGEGASVDFNQQEARDNREMEYGDYFMRVECEYSCSLVAHTCRGFRGQKLLEPRCVDVRVVVAYDNIDRQIRNIENVNAQSRDMKIKLPGVFSVLGKYSTISTVGEVQYCAELGIFIHFGYLLLYIRNAMLPSRSSPMYMYSRRYNFSIRYRLCRKYCSYSVFWPRTSS